MPANAISARVAEFLAKYPPFDICPPKELMLVSEAITIQYLPAGEVILREGDNAHKSFYVVRQGSVKIFQNQTEELIDVCDEGDIFGVRALLSAEPYLATAQTIEECLLYAIPVEVAKKTLMTHERIAFFFEMGYSSGKPMMRLQRKSGKLIGNSDAQNLPVLNESISIKGSSNVLMAAPDVPIRDAAKLMSERKVGSIVISLNKKPLGIVTDKDLRNKVVTGLVDIYEPLESIMSSPVKCISPGLSVAECMLIMMDIGAQHLCITKDGTPNSQIMAIVSDYDLLVEQGYTPSVIVKELRKTLDVEGLKSLRDKADKLLHKYIEHEVSITYTSRMMTAVNDALLHSLIHQGINKIGEPPCAFAWLALGSQGRGEQLLRTDQDHALVFENSMFAHDARTYFLKLANYVVLNLEKFGFASDAANIGANHPEWCLTLDEWKQLFSRWTKVPNNENILLSTIFFDFRPAFGDDSLSIAMANHLFEAMQQSQIFLPMLAENAMANPAPLSFFRNFVVEKSGEHKDAFDLKLRALLPLIDAARVLTLQHRLCAVNNTAERFLKIADFEPNHKTLMTEASDSYQFLSRLRAQSGFKNLDSGRYIKIDELTKMQRQQLRSIFSTVNELQSILKVRFQTNLLRG